MNKYPVSLVINTKNEEGNIAECIQSAIDFASEIIVVDMYSKDKTVDIAQKLGATVFQVTDRGYVEPARNYAIRKAKNPWVLLLDADERASKTLLYRLKSIITEDKYDVVWLPRQNLRFGKWLQHGGFWPDEQLRFFKKNAVKWSSTIHKHPKIIGKQLHLQAKIQNALIHYNLNSVQAMLDKINTYTLHESYFSSLGEVKVEQLYHAIQNEFSSRFFRQEGFKDGIDGFIAAKAMEYYRFVEFARYWEQKKYKKLFDSNALRVAFSTQEKLESLQKELTEIQDSKVFFIIRFYFYLKKNLQKVLNISP